MPVDSNQSAIRRAVSCDVPITGITSSAARSLRCRLSRSSTAAFAAIAC
jgi:hypothetical protein